MTELAGLVSEALARNGITAVLSGGAGVSVYTENRYESSDLDFVTRATVSEIAEALLPLGFEHSHGDRFDHPDSDHYLEFVRWPPAVGKMTITKWSTFQTPSGTIQVLTATQVVMDRLAAYFRWNDPQALQQAVMVSRDNDLDWDDLEAWVRGEEKESMYQVFKRAAQIR